MCPICLDRGAPPAPCRRAHFHEVCLAEWVWHGAPFCCPTCRRRLPRAFVKGILRRKLEGDREFRSQMTNVCNSFFAVFVEFALLNQHTNTGCSNTNVLLFLFQFMNNLKERRRTEKDPREAIRLHTLTEEVILTGWGVFGLLFYPLFSWCVYREMQGRA